MNQLIFIEYHLSKLLIIGLLISLMMGCHAKNTASTDSSNEELRLLTPEQEKKLISLAERTEEKPKLQQAVLDDKGNQIGTMTSQTTVIYLKPGGGLRGGRFSVNTTCVSSCTGTPVNLDPSKANNVCECDKDCAKCTGAVDSQGCTGTCTKVTTGWGNFGIFIAKNQETLNGSIVLK